MDNIKKTFCKKFEPWNITINENEVFVGNKKTIPSRACHVKYSIQENEKGIFLEYYGIHSSKEHLHGRIYQDGKEEELEVLRQYIAYSPSVPGDRERSDLDFEKYNRRVMSELKQKGLI